ncbi:MAG: tRNA(fMet)-specific endonuclease VapC [Candidatus Aerophobetes bacterium ADurb.Bin490]|nr:MAG: tRNA(fMet)-specific endonuclease VapC [Candidatus Aerophobetes bacterium ADurb.Bin490]HPN64535.1 type II toxin-antitoxin system VapC family toxin [Candidatus Goldiibacteriota bacterium]
MRFVLDSYAMISFLQREKGFETVKNAMEKSIQKGIKTLMTTVNWGEVYYIIKREEGALVADAMVEIMDTLPVELLPADREITRKAAALKSEKKMSYADCFAAAAAIMNKAVLITGDKEFKKVEKQIETEWI